MSFGRQQLVRILLIHQQLAQRGYPTQERLAELCGVSARTIKRDMKMMREELGAPILYDTARDGNYYSKPFLLMPEAFQPEEVMALCLTLEVADSFRDTPFAPALKKAIARVRLLQPGGSGPGGAISAVADPLPLEDVGMVLHFNRLLDAIKSSRQVRIDYHANTSDADSTRVIDPYHLYYSYGLWYVYAYCHLRQARRDFAIGRISKLETLPGAFTPPDAEALRAQLAQRFSNETPVTPAELTEVRIRFDATGARWIRERAWHPSQQCEEHPDGSITLTLQVMGLAGVRRWLLGFGGAHATPLSPPAFVAEVREELVAMLENLPGE